MMSVKNLSDGFFGHKKKDARSPAASIALVGNPNVGKSTLFNSLTGMNQHTGNWPGKTVLTADGCFSVSGPPESTYIITDLPGTYSLSAHSPEEETARDFICRGRNGTPPELAIVVCDAGCLERNMLLVLQTLEISKRVIVCVNMLEDAHRRGVSIDCGLLSSRLGVPVIGICARNRRGVRPLTDALPAALASPEYFFPVPVKYPPAVETAASVVKKALGTVSDGAGGTSKRWLGLELLERGSNAAREYLPPEADIRALDRALAEAWDILSSAGYKRETFGDELAAARVMHAEEICRGVIVSDGHHGGYGTRDRRIDRLLTGRTAGYPAMLILLALVFWITIKGANYPSELLSAFFTRLEGLLMQSADRIGAPEWLSGALILGVFRVLGWVISVMLPPMAIFFPLFTLLEDSGYLPRIAYNLDRPFCRCHACGKQALTMCMGLGCNAAGVVGCRIIDSPRERLLAILTNSFVPCNGRFPSMITVISLFVITGSGIVPSVMSAIMIAAVITLGVFMTFVATGLLSCTLLRGEPSAFTLELPPYRKPQVGRVIVRSMLDRTLFVLGRSAAVAAPAGLIIWLLANLKFGGTSVLSAAAGFIDPAGRLMGLDGAILLGFILGLPANEIVLPITMMVYLAAGTLPELGSGAAIQALLVANGWSARTAVCFVLFSLLHWPCSTTLLTVKKETGSVRWMAVAAILPTLAGFAITIAVNALWTLFTGG